MQKIILMVVGLLVLSGCASLSQTATPESAQRFVKLRGYEPDEKGFFAAVQARDLMAINAFFDAGINGNAQDGDGRTALSYAAARGDLEIVNALLSRGVDPNIKDKLGYTALSHAVDAKYDEVVDVLLNRSMLDPNARGLNGRPILLAFVWRDDKARVEKLLARGAEVNAQDADGDTALHGAAQGGNVEIAQLLLDKGAGVNAKNKHGGTPLMWAAVYGHQDAAQLLLSRGADASLKDNDGNTAADWAVRNKRAEVVQVLKRKR
jgi:ankyrin repeat protein